jgi:hypothetical protein
MKSTLFASFSLFCALGLGACFSPDTGTHVNALTGEECEPDSTSYIPREAPDHCQGTSNGDNCDDLHSGKIDCIGDGNSGQGDDKKHNCEFPQPGCDENGCCDDDMVDPPPGDGDDPDDGDDGDGDDGGDDGDGDDGGGDDGGGDDPTPEPEPEPDPVPVPDVG